MPSVSKSSALKSIGPYEVILANTQVAVYYGPHMLADRGYGSFIKANESFENIKSIKDAERFIGRNKKKSNPKAPLYIVQKLKLVKAPKYKNKYKKVWEDVSRHRKSINAVTKAYKIIDSSPSKLTQARIVDGRTGNVILHTEAVEWDPQEDAPYPVKLGGKTTIVRRLGAKTGTEKRKGLVRPNPHSYELQLGRVVQLELLDPRSGEEVTLGPYTTIEGRKLNRYRLTWKGKGKKGQLKFIVPVKRGTNALSQEVLKQHQQFHSNMPSSTLIGDDGLPHGKLRQVGLVKAITYNAKGLASSKGGDNWRHVFGDRGHQGRESYPCSKMPALMTDGRHLFLRRRKGNTYYVGPYKDGMAWIIA